MARSPHKNANPDSNHHADAHCHDRNHRRYAYPDAYAYCDCDIRKPMSVRHIEREFCRNYRRIY
ncbi:MAG: hypothetical protein F4Y44_01930 [Chloroflexi bacterium]|nr:hypothetical protein [Chloroflexota bacterium]